MYRYTAKCIELYHVYQNVISWLFDYVELTPLGQGDLGLLDMQLFGERIVISLNLS
jgi:hypothetical protein